MRRGGVREGEEIAGRPVTGGRRQGTGAGGRAEAPRNY